MAWTAKRVKSLLEEDEEMEDVLETVKTAADDNGGVVTWSDVEDDITSGQWGRIIEEGILESTDEGFQFADPDGVEEILGGGIDDLDFEVEIPEVTLDSDPSWTKWDKGAAVATGLLFIGYWSDAAQDLIGATLNLLFGPLNDVLPFYMVIFAAALFTGLYTSLLQANLMNTEVIAAYRDQMNAVQEQKQRAEEAGNEEAVKEIEQQQVDMVGDQLEMFKEQFRPMVWVMLFTIPIFLWIWWVSGEITTGMVMPIFGEIGPGEWNDGILGPLRPWILWYIVSSISLTQVIRKTLNIEVMPT